MKRAILILALLATPATAQPYTRADFRRGCIAMAPATEPARSAWIRSCSKEAP